MAGTNGVRGDHSGWDCRRLGRRCGSSLALVGLDGTAAGAKPFVLAGCKLLAALIPDRLADTA
jgi:hypothetical protein